MSSTGKSLDMIPIPMIKGHKITWPFRSKKPFGIDELNNWLNQCEKGIDPSRELWDWFKHKKEKG